MVRVDGRVLFELDNWEFQRCNGKEKDKGRGQRGGQFEGRGMQNVISKRPSRAEMISDILCVYVLMKVDELREAPGREKKAGV